MASSQGLRDPKSRIMNKLTKEAPPPSYSAFYPGTTTSSTTTSTGIPKNTVFYAIYPDDLQQPNLFYMTEDEYQTLSHSLHPIHLRILEILSPYTTDYIWQHEPFTLSLSSFLLKPNPKTCPCSPENLPHFHGKTNFGDALEDEWFVVFLLFEISRKIPDVSIKVWDSDGEFLLFEAAEFVPRWLNPETSRNRVFIRDGKVHILHKDNMSSGSKLLEMLGFLAMWEDDVGAPKSVQLALEKRISGYPERAKSNMHRVRVRVPISVAKVLKQEPCLISLAVEGFCDRDDTDSRNFAEKMEKFLSGGGTGKEKEEELVRVSVRMSRAMYAKLVQQNFESPKCYPMPPKTDSSVYVESVLGMKIACGFEMMYQKRRREGMDAKRITWESFKEGLESNGYFKERHPYKDDVTEHLPGSQEYCRLLGCAEEYYRKTSLFSRTSDVMNAPVRHIDEILSLPRYAWEFKGGDLPPSDDDAWLDNGEDELKSAMLERQKQMKVFESNGKKIHKANEKKGADLSAAPALNKVSSYKDAGFPVNRESRDSNPVVPNMEHLVEDMESLQLGSRGTVDYADSEEDYGAVGGYDYGSDFSYDDFTNPFMYDEDGTYTGKVNKEQELMYATLMNSFFHVNEQSFTKNHEGTSQQGHPESASTLLGLFGLQPPKDHTVGISSPAETPAGASRKSKKKARNQQSQKGKF